MIKAPEFIIDSSISVCDQDTKGGTCRVEANVMIAAPLDSVPTRMPYIHKDLSFGSTIFNGTFTK